MTETLYETPATSDTEPKSRTLRYAMATFAGVIAGGLITGAVMNGQIDDAAATASAQVAAAEQRADDAISWSESAIEQREAAVSERESAATTKEEELAEREASVTKTEEKIDASQIEPGTYLVPEELKPGRYRTTENVTGMCYMKQQKNGNIVDNMLETSGRPVFTVQNVSGSELIIDVECGTVEKI